MRRILQSAFLKTPLLKSLVVAAMLTGSATASAHHSIAGFDRNNPIIVTGTLKQFVWANPHTWIYLVVPNDKGVMEEWKLEGISVAGMARSGWSKKMLTAGQKLRIRVAPRRDGENGGEWLDLMEIDGAKPVRSGALQENNPP